MIMRILQFGLWFLVFGFTINAQNAKLGGIVTDENGAVIPDTTIELSDNGGKKYRVSTDYEGIYRIELPSGLYMIRISRSPFTAFLIVDYWIPQGCTMKLDVALRCVGCEIIEHPVEPTLIEMKEQNNDEPRQIMKRPLVKLLKEPSKINKGKKNN